MKNLSQGVLRVYKVSKLLVTHPGANNLKKRGLTQFQHFSSTGGKAPFPSLIYHTLLLPSL